MKSLGTILALLICASAAALSAHGLLAAQGSSSEHIFVIDDFETPRNWLTWAGDSRPLPTGDLRIVNDDPHSGRKCGSFYFDTSCDHGYVATELRQTFPPQAKAARFWVRTPGEVRFTVRVQDGSGQTHQISLPQSKSSWQRIVLDLTQPWPHHYGGRDDGTMHEPIRSIQFLRESGSNPKVGAIYVDDIEVVSTAPAEQLTDYYWKHQNILLQTDVPANLFYPTDAVKAELTVAAPPREIEIVATAAISDAHNERVAELGPLSLTRENAYSNILELPNALGHYKIALRVTDGADHKMLVSRYAVIPANPALTKTEPKSPFGVNTHFNQGWPAKVGQMVKRAGIAWIRDGEADLDDRARSVARANNLCYLPCFTRYRGKLADMFKKTLERDPNFSGKWDFKEAIQWHRKYAEKYGADIDCYDLMNEPHGPWGNALGGSWWGGKWLKTFALYGRQVTEAIHAADPGSTVLWEDIDQLLWYKDFLKLGVADVIGGISPHPYNLHPSNPLPEEHPMISQLKEFHGFCHEHNLAWQVWSGEVGFPSFERNEATPSPFHTPHTETEQAELLVRMMVVELCAGVEKIFWYDFRNDGRDPHNIEHNFGLITLDHLPKPAIVAYANLIHQTRGCRWLGRCIIGGGADAFAFVTKECPKPTLIAWVRRGEKTEPIPVFSGATEATVTNLYGASERIPIRNKRLLSKLSSSPVYIEGLEAQDVAPLLEKPTDTGRN